MIRVSYLTKCYGELRAVDEQSFEIAQGECVGLLGLNGAGKTTLLRMLSCLLTPTSGAASIDGFDVSDQPDEVRRRIGFLPETPPLYGEMDVDRFLAFTAQLRGVDASLVDERVAQAIERCRLQAVARQRIDTLSFGYRKRVGIAQAIVHQPPLVILDEPIAGLDPAQIVDMRALIRSLHGKHTILLSSHILSEISQTCDRILLIHRGRIAAQGSEEELLASLAQASRIRIQVSGDRARCEEVLGGIDGLDEFHLIGEAGGAFSLELSSAGDIRAKVARALIEADLDLLELSGALDDLESVFLKLTEREEAAP
jgi:ABC-2 type transport system ATP-binding protein